MKRNCGSALIETLVASFILVSGLVAVASMFSAAEDVRIRNQQGATATLLLYEKMEQLHAAGSASGGSLDPRHPEAGFADYVRIASDGKLRISDDDPGSAYLRVWQVQDSANPVTTIAVFAALGPALPAELARATGPR